MFYVQNHYAFAAALLEALNPVTPNVLGTELDCTDDHRYYFPSSCFKCDYILPAIVPYVHRLPAQHSVRQTHQELF